MYTMFLLIKHSDLSTGKSYKRFAAIVCRMIPYNRFLSRQLYFANFAKFLGIRKIKIHENFGVATHRGNKRLFAKFVFTNTFLRLIREI